MKFKYLFLFLVCSFSFYYVEKVALNIKDKNPIMQNINEIADSLHVNSIDSKLIEDTYIIPGLNGKEVNKNKSFNNMKVFEEFNETNLVYDQLTPNVSLKDNKDRIIIRGNEAKKAVSIIFEENNNLAKYMSQKNYKVNIFLNKEEYSNKYELINTSSNETTYKNIDKYLSKNNLSNNLCYVKDKIPKLCKNKYLFRPSLTITSSTLNENKNKISSGEIILIKNGLSLEELEIIINQIKYQDLDILPLSDLISETNS